MPDVFSKCKWAALLLAISIAVGCGTTNDQGGQAGQEAQGGSLKRIILLTNGNSPFWDACRVGLQEGVKEFQLAGAGLTAVLEVNDGTVQGQLDKLRQFATQSDIVGVAIAALDANNVAVADAMRELRGKGVFVLCVDSDVNRETQRNAREFYIGTDNFAGGRALGIACKSLLERRGVESGSYVQFVGYTSSLNAQQRMGGFNEGVGEAYREADRMGDELDRTRARDNVRNAIRNHTDLQALVGIWSYNAPAMVDVVKQENIRDRVTVVTFDAEPIAIANMKEGFLDVMVVQNPYQMGYRVVQCLKALIGGDEATVDELFPNREQEGGDLYDTGLKVVAPSDASPLRAEMFSDKTEFMMLKEFQVWLDKYNLTGS